MERSAAFTPDATSSSVQAPRPPASGSVQAPRPPVSGRAPDLPGCESFHLPESALDDYDGRFEFWDGKTETAWRVREPTSIWHEQPTRRLTRLAERVASLRGSPIECFGSADLLRPDAAGSKRWIMQADEVLYLHPGRARISGPAVVVGADTLPDVVLEVDHSTDVRRWKLGVYQECGFPEIWVAVPWDHSTRRPGLTIHVRGDEGYAEAAESRAFPGWTAGAIHRALTEEPISAEAWGALERVARAMGEREGTTLADDPIMRSVSRRAEAKGRADAVSATLRLRGIDVPADLAAALQRIPDVPLGVVLAAALACTAAGDFRRRLREAAGARRRQ